jgi:hypothetical protein
VSTLQIQNSRENGPRKIHRGQNKQALQISGAIRFHRKHTNRCSLHPWNQQNGLYRLYVFVTALPREEHRGDNRIVLDQEGEQNSKRLYYRRLDRQV